MEELIQQLEELKETEQFIEYQKENPDIILTSCFFLTDTLEKFDWELNFYSPKKHKHIIFKETVEEHEVFQKEEKELEELNLEKVKITFQEAWEKLEKEAKHHSLSKAIVVLQLLNSQIIWNLTYITNELKFINLKVDAITGEIISKQESSLTDLRDKQ